MRLPRLFGGNYHRLTLFWALALAGLALPWLASCEVRGIPGGSAERACLVNSVHDGDTLRLTCDGEHLEVRLYCIDAPELAQRPWGQESPDHLRRITPKQVLLVPKEKDRYGRTVGELLASDGTRASINLRMVADCQAAVYPKHCHERRFYRAECGSCHLAYPPGLLPADGWRRVMGDLANHYGDDASPDAATTDRILGYLVVNSADGNKRLRSRAFAATRDSGNGPPRTTETLYFQRKHDEVPQRMVRDNPGGQSFSRCETCHGGADQGRFNEDDVRTPGWDAGTTEVAARHQPRRSG